MTQADFAKRLAELKAAIVGRLPPAEGLEGDPEGMANAAIVRTGLDIAEEFLLDVKRIADAAQR